MLAELRDTEVWDPCLHAQAFANTFGSDGSLKPGETGNDNPAGVKLAQG